MSKMTINRSARKVRRQGTLADFFSASPLRNAGVAIKRLKDGPRELDL